MAQIDVSQISSADTRTLGSTFFNAVKKFYEDPKHLKAFEEWKAKEIKEADNDGTYSNR